MTDGVEEHVVSGKGPVTRHLCQENCGFFKMTHKHLKFFEKTFNNENNTNIAQSRLYK
jgi:hypothetical protein